MDAGEVELERGVEECAVMCFGGLQRTPIGNQKTFSTREEGARSLSGIVKFESEAPF